MGFSRKREGLLIHTNVPKALTQVLELDLQVYVSFVLAERATGMLLKEKPIYQIGEDCSGGNNTEDHQDSSPRMNLIISGTAMQWQVSKGEMDLAHPGASEMRRDKAEGNGSTRRGKTPGQANISSCLWGLLDLKWEPHKEKVERIKGEREREPVGRLGTPDEELRGTQEEPCSRDQVGSFRSMGGEWKSWLVLKDEPRINYRTCTPDVSES